MKLLGQIIRTAVNVALIPVAMAKDVVTLGGVLHDESKPYTLQQLDKTKDEASE